MSAKVTCSAERLHTNQSPDHWSSGNQNIHCSVYPNMLNYMYTVTLTHTDPQALKSDFISPPSPPPPIPSSPHPLLPPSPPPSSTSLHPSPFSFDAHLQKDLPAMVDYTLTVSKQKQLFYVGHSQGTVMGFGGFTFNKTLAAQVNAFFALAPVAMVTHVQGAFYLLSKFYKQLEVSFD